MDTNLPLAPRGITTLDMEEPVAANKPIFTSIPDRMVSDTKSPYGLVQRKRFQREYRNDPNAFRCFVGFRPMHETENGWRFAAGRFGLDAPGKNNTLVSRFSPVDDARFGVGVVILDVLDVAKGEKDSYVSYTRSMLTPDGFDLEKIEVFGFGSSRKTRKKRYVKSLRSFKLMLGLPRGNYTPSDDAEVEEWLYNFDRENGLMITSPENLMNAVYGAFERQITGFLSRRAGTQK